MDEWYRRQIEEAANPSHPAHGLFEWNDSNAAELYRVKQLNEIVLPGAQELKRSGDMAFSEDEIDLPNLESKTLRFANDQDHKNRLGRLIIAEDAVLYCILPDPDPAFCRALIACLDWNLEAFEKEFEVFDTQSMTLYSGYNALWVVEDACGPVKEFWMSMHDIECFAEFR